MEPRMNGHSSSPILIPSPPLNGYLPSSSLTNGYHRHRSGSVSSGLPMIVKADTSKVELRLSNGMGKDLGHQGYSLNRSDLEVHHEFQKLQIKQLEERLHREKLHLIQTQRLLEQGWMEVDHDDSNDRLPDSHNEFRRLPEEELEETNLQEVEGRKFHTTSLLPLVENRENLTNYETGELSSNHINGGVNPDDFESKVHNSYLPRCNSVGSSNLNNVYKRSDVFKRRENILAGSKNGAAFDPSQLSESESSTSYHKQPFEHLKRPHRSENVNSPASLPNGLKAMDLTCKRKRSLDNRMASEASSDEQVHHHHHHHNTKISTTRDQHSILKSVLTSSSSSVEAGGRLRSHTLSVCSLQGLRRSGTNGSFIYSDSRRVTLAKKNLAPVQRFVMDQLKETVRFACRQPDFNQLPMEDKRALLAQAGPRLLLLYMAELNFKFAVTLLWEPVEKSDKSDFQDEKSDLRDERLSSSPEKEVPTQRFVEIIQNFIGKCQSQSITTDEYFYMRLIVLFHIGSEPLSQNKFVAKQHNEAQQDLQALSVHKFPTDRLRYSKLLLTLYTLFGVDGVLVESLFYSSENHGSMAEFLCSELEQVSSSPPVSFQVFMERTKTHM